MARRVAKRLGVGFVAACAMSLALALGPSVIASAKDPALPSELEGIEIEDRRGATLPRDVELRDTEGNAVRLGDYLDGKRPVVIVLAYFECPMLCSMVINGALTSMKGMPWTAGQEYRALVVSFDPRDNVATASAKRAAYLASYGRTVGPRSFDFDVGAPDQVAQVAAALGFHYRWDEKTKQFAHAAAAFVVTPDGRISRTLYGISFPDLRIALLEASEGRVGNVAERLLLFCYHYDASAKGYVLATTRLMRLAGLLTLAAVGTLLVLFWRAERRSARGEPASHGREAGRT